MNEFFKNFKKNMLVNLALIAVLFCTLVYLVILTLNIFGITSIKFYDKFNYLVAYIFIIISLCIFILGFWVEKITNLNIPQWFQIVFFIAFFIFTNIYYATNAYNNISTLMFFYMYLSFISTIANVSIFYNVQKDENNRLKVSKPYILTSIFFYSVGTNSIVMFLISTIMCLFLPHHSFTSLSTFVLGFLSMTLITAIMIIAYGISLAHSKRFINSCLLKTNRN